MSTWQLRNLERPWGPFDGLSILIEALGLKLGDDGTITRFLQLRTWGAPGTDARRCTGSVLEGVSALDVKNNDLNVQNDLGEKAFCTRPLLCGSATNRVHSLHMGPFCSHVAKVTIPQ